MKRKATAIVAFILFSQVIAAFGEPLTQPLVPYLQSISVTIKADRGQGSGVLVTRELKDKDGKPVKVNFVWTAAHVLSRLRKTRKVVDAKGQAKTVVEFKDAEIVQEIVDNGRRVGEIKMLAKVIKYSDATEGQDLALLMIRKRAFTDDSAVLYDGKDNVVPIGTKLFHVGSLLGQFGANSLTTGIVSQIGRIINIGSSGGGVVFDQTTVNAFPGSSGGGVFIAGGPNMEAHKGQYCGMIVRGAGETFNLVVPIRRMRSWALAAGCLWAIENNPKNTPTLAELTDDKWVIENMGGGWHTGGQHEKAHGFHFWLRDWTKPGAVLLKDEN